MKTKPLVLVEALASRNDSGLGKHVRMFLDGLRGLADTAEVMAVLPEGGPFRPGPHLRPLYVRPRPMRLWTQWSFPRLIRRHAPDLVLCLGHTLPWWRPPARYALLIADAGPLEDVPWPMSSHETHNRKWLRRMPAKADLIITSAEFTRGRLVQLLGLDPGRIRIVRPIHPDYFAGSTAPSPPGEGEDGGGPAPPEGPYFLAAGNVEPRKNFPGLITAYAELLRRRPDAPPLCIAGHPAWGFGEAAEAAAELGLGEAVRFLGYLPDAELRAWMEGCLAFVSSSLYEGWGLPLFEALALGKPALYHRESSQEEYARGMALAVDCSDPAQLSEGLERLWADAGERERCAAALRAGFGRVLDYDLEGALREALLPLIAPVTGRPSAPA